jgi:hypothetical protein
MNQASNRREDFVEVFGIPILAPYVEVTEGNKVTEVRG